MRKTLFFELLLACILNQHVAARQHRDALSPPADRTTKHPTSTTYLVSDASDAPDPDIFDGIYDPPTLRSAIENANFQGGTNSIVFAAGLTVIQPLSPLSGLTGQVTIDGTVAAGKIILDGSLVPVSTSGIFLIAANSAVRNMEFRGWFSGISFAGTAPNCIIQRNIFTLNVTGVSATVSNTLIGGPNPEDRNLAYSNTQDGIAVSASANDVIIQNNFCGTPDGLTAGPNARAGIYSRGQRTRILGNILSGNQGPGLEITQAAVNTLVSGNVIGADSTRRGSLPNNGDGIRTSASRDSIVDNVITGNATGIMILSLADETVIRRNIIGPNGTLDSLFGNRFDGIQLLGDHAVIDSNIVSGNKFNGIRITGVGGARVRRNMIGTDPTGTLDWGNTSAGVLIQACTTTVGGPSPDDFNVVSGNGGAGIEIYGGLAAPNNVFGNVIENNVIGTDIIGTFALPNSTGLLMRGYVDSNVVRYNLISGNDFDGVSISGVSATGNILMNNMIGTDFIGTLGVGNQGAGVAIEQGASGNVLHWNVISGNTGWGVLLSVSMGQFPTGNIITGNTIGLDVTQSDTLPNYTGGILLDGARNTVVGGPTADSANVISGNGGWGVYMYGLARGNEVCNNLIGTSGSGDGSLPNGIGIFIQGSQANTIGGLDAGSGNVVSGNTGDGIRLENSDSNNIQGNTIGLNEQQTQVLGNGGMGVYLDQSYDNLIGSVGNIIGGNNMGIYSTYSDGNRILGNKIGTGLSGTEDFGNLNHGVFLDDWSTRTQVGMEGAGNDIAFNGGHGVTMFGPSEMNALSGNSIHSNGWLGIDLGDDWITLNDESDPDSGANDLQNFPVITLAEGSAQLLLYGGLQSAADVPYRVEFFANPVCDSGDHGEGERYLGFTNVTTNLFGNGVFTVILPVTVSPGEFITATATDSAGNTSEFSKCTEVFPPGAYADIAVAVTDSADTVSLSAVLTYEILVRNNGPDTASGVVLKDTLSSRVSFNSDSTTHGTCTLSNGILTCSIGSLAVGEDARVTVEVRADSLGPIHNKAVATANEADYIIQNNSATDTTVAVTVTAVGEAPTRVLPTVPDILQNYPNPFNPSTTIRYELPAASHVTLKVFNALGQEVALLVDGMQDAGYKSVMWDASSLTNGVYYYQLTAGEYFATKKMILMK